MSVTRIQYELIRLLEQGGRHLGLSQSAVNFIRYCLRHTQDVDWEPGNRAIIYKSVQAMARENDLSERQIYNLEQSICEKLGTLVSLPANKRRYGQRDSENGRIIFAFGLDLTPLKAIIPALRKKIAAAQEQYQEWCHIRRKLSAERRHIRLLCQRRQDDLPVSLCEKMRGIEGKLTVQMSLDALRSRLFTAMDIRQCLERDEVERDEVERKSCEKVVESSDPSEKKFRHKEYPTEYPTDENSSDCKGADKNDSLLSASTAAKAGRYASGAEHVSLRAAWNAASERFRDLMGDPPIGHQGDVTPLIKAAQNSLRRLGIARFQWDEACHILGNYGAAICVLITERRHGLRQVEASCPYFQAMVRRALIGKLAVHRSVFGLIWAERTR